MLTKDDYRAILRATDDELLVAYMILINSEKLHFRLWNTSIFNEKFVLDRNRAIGFSF